MAEAADGDVGAPGGVMSSMRSGGDDGGAVMDVKRSRFPYALVWTPIPCITWFLPFVGHMGIADSQGVIHDFAGPYYIGHDDMAFGKPTRYLVLDPRRMDSPSTAVLSDAWDRSVEYGNQVYCKRMHNLCCDNCHSHVARCLNHMQYGGKSNWNMVKLAAWMFFRGKHVNAARAVATWLPFMVLVCVVLLFSLLL